MAGVGGKREGAGRKTLPLILKKIPIGLKLPRWLIERLYEEEKSRAVVIERALCKTYGWKPPAISTDNER